MQAQDLSTVECCCTELRHTASSDMFWQPLFQLEFGFVTSHEKMQAGRLGWQGMFTHKWTERCVASCHVKFVRMLYCVVIGGTDATLVLQKPARSAYCSCYAGLPVNCTAF